MAERSAIRITKERADVTYPCGCIIFLRRGWKVADVDRLCAIHRPEEQ